MAVLKMTVKDIEEYWERLSDNLTYLLHYLKGKAEYGSCAGENGVQHIVLFTAEEIARERSLNVNVVSALCKAVALCFPTRGFAELAVIKEFIQKKNLDIALDTLEIDTIEYIIYDSGSTVTPELDNILHKYYSDDESIAEVNLVRFLQKYLNMNRKLLFECSFADSGRVADEIMKCAKAEYETSYRLLPDTIASPVPQNIKDEIEANIVTFIEFSDDVTAGIYQAIM